MSRSQGQSPILELTLDEPTRVLVRLAAAVAGGRADLLSERAREASQAQVPAIWVDELLLLSMLMVGWPRALGAAAVWRRESGIRAPATDASASETLEAWRIRGEALCRAIYGSNYERLRDNVRALHPALDAWMVRDGYGMVLSRPGLDLVRRELCVIAQTAVLEAGPQLLSHLKGAMNAGADAALLDGVVELLSPDLASSAREQLVELAGRAKRKEQSAKDSEQNGRNL